MSNRKHAVTGGALAAALVLAAALAPGAAQAQAATDRYLLSFKPGAAAAARAAVAATGGRVEVDLDWIDAVAVTLPVQAVKGLSRNPAVEMIEPDPMRRALWNGEWQQNPDGIHAVQADLVAYGAAARTLCIVDSGYDINHPDLPRPPLSSVTGVNLTRSGDWNTDETGHGTHVAGTVAALDNAIGVRGVVGSGALNLHIAKVFDASGSARSSVIMKAVKACAKAGAHVISMSLGGGAPTRGEQRAYDRIAASGILVVAAAGNDGTTAISYPAGYPSVMSVAAVEIEPLTFDATWADFSQANADVEIAAPGVGVLSTVPLGTGRSVSLAVAGTPIQALAMDGSPTGSVTAPLYDFGRGTARDPGASGKVCLIERGDITFADKVVNCQASGGVGAVIYNNASGNFNGTLGTTVTNIPSMSIAQADGQTLLTKVGQSTTMSVTATDYARNSGTSMATPHVSGVAALVWSHFPLCSAEQVRAALNATAKDIGDTGRDDKTGHGLVQAAGAYSNLLATCGAN